VVAVNNWSGATTGVTDPRRRFGTDGTTQSGTPVNFPNWNLTGAFLGDDLLMSDVLSFDIKVVMQNSGGTGDVPALVDLPPASMNAATGVLGSSSNNSDFQAAQAVVFDTWCSQGPYASWATPGTATSLPLAARILAIQVTLRVWDNRTQQARQVAIIQDM
jgi:hypothetical protein